MYYTPGLDEKRAKNAVLVRDALIGVLALSIVIAAAQILSGNHSLLAWFSAFVLLVVGFVFLEIRNTPSERVEVVDVMNVHAMIWKTGFHVKVRWLMDIPPRNRGDLRVQIIKTFTEGSVLIELEEEGERAEVTGGQAGIRVGDSDDEILRYLFGVAGGKPQVTNAAKVAFEDAIQSHLATLPLDQVRLIFGASISSKLNELVESTLQQYGVVPMGYSFGGADEAPGTRKRRDIIAQRDDFFAAMIVKAKEMAYVTMSDADLVKPENVEVLALVQRQQTEATNILLKTTLFAALTEGEGLTAFANIGDLMKGFLGGS